MFATTMTGNGDEVVAVVEVDEEEVDEDALVVDEADVVEEEDAEVVLPLLLWPPCTVDVTVFVTVFVVALGGGAGGWAVDGAKRLLATEAMPAVTKTAPSVIATMRKCLRGLSSFGMEMPPSFAVSPLPELSSFDVIGYPQLIPVREGVPICAGPSLHIL